MCRSIKPLYNYEPAATDEDIHAAALQFVRKVSGYRKPSKQNEAAFNVAVDEITHAVQHLLGNLHTHTSPKQRIS
jgi:hypothetical protein